MGRMVAIPNDAAFRALWEGSAPRAEIARLYGVSHNAVTAAAQRYGLKPRQVWSKEAMVKQGAAAQECAGADDPRARLLDRLSRARESGKIPVPPRWSFERDAQLLLCGGRHREIAALADAWGMSCARVRARWHLLEVV